MKIDFNKTLKNFKEEAMKEKVEEEKNGKKILVEKEITIKSICVNSLMVNDPKERINGEEKLKRYDLATKIFKSEGELELSAEEVVLIKKLVGDNMSTLVVGFVFRILEGEEKNKKVWLKWWN